MYEVQRLIERERTSERKSDCLDSNAGGKNTFTLAEPLERFSQKGTHLLAKLVFSGDNDYQARKESE